MSVLIKGMEMPTGEPLLVKINPDGTVSTTARNNYKKYEAVELPPHGRLIDEDAIYNCDMLYRFITYQGNWVYSRKAIQYAPTIIEAEEVSE